MEVTQERSEQSKVNLKAIEELNSIAHEQDGEFVQQTKKLIPSLPESVRGEAQKFAESITTASVPSFTELLYIPIFHKTKGRENADRKLKSEIFKILRDQHKVPTLIAVGDACVPRYTRSALGNSRQKVLAMYQELGFIDRIHTNNMRLDGYEDAIVDFTARNPEFIAIGVDSDMGQLIGGLDLFPNLFPSVEVGNTVRFRFGVEGRTRLALSRTAELAKQGERVIFVQGVMHKRGIETWCQRNSVNLKAIIPNAVKPYLFFGQ